MKDLSSSKDFERMTLTIFLFRCCELVRAGLFQVPTEEEGADSNQGMVDSLSPNTAAFLTLTETRQMGLCRRFRLPSCNGNSKA